MWARLYSLRNHLVSSSSSSCLQPRRFPLGIINPIRGYAKKSRLSTVRNIGISAHIDSGKTTLTERFLYYTGRIDEIHEVRGKDGVGAKMDSMDLEREKGITIKSAATHVSWRDHIINIIDTPGHVDFTIEVERSLQVLDGAILVICGVNGVQSQTMTVDRQMKRYRVPRLGFINKLDRLGADPWKAIKGLKEKLGIACAALQVPLGVQQAHAGIIDIITRQTVTFEGSNGEFLQYSNVPERYVQIVEEKRKVLLDTIADVDDEFAEKVLEGEDVSVEDIKAAIRRAVIARKFVPIFMGSAFKNKGVQLLLDGVLEYLPSPLDREVVAYSTDKATEGNKVILEPDPKKPFVGYAFKIEESKFGQITWLRIYQGTIKKLQTILNTNTNQRIKIPRIAHMHAGELEDIPEASAGDICALFGVDCASGETFTDGTNLLQMTPMHVPNSVISLAVDVKSKQQVQNFNKALKRFQREDPTFRVTKDPETQETLIEGMGELHLEIYIERMKREYELQLVVGKPRVAYRETVTGEATFEYTHKKQTGGAGQYAKIIGRIEPIGENETYVNDKGETVPLLRDFVNSLIGNDIPPNYVPAIQKGYEDCMERGPLIGNPIERVRMVITDGAHHPVDSSEFAFRTCSQFAFRQGFMAAEPSLLEPIMNVEITAPMEFQSAILTLINKRRGTIINSTIDSSTVVVEAEVPLALMFGYATDLRSVTEGKGEFSMEYKRHALVPSDRLAAIVEEYRKKNSNEAQSKK